MVFVLSVLVSGVTMREKKGGALQKLKKRLSHSFGRLSKFHCVLFFFCFGFFLVKIIVRGVGN